MKKLINLSLLLIMFSVTAIAQENNKTKTILDLQVYERFVEEFNLTTQQQEKAKKIVLKANEKAATLQQDLEQLDATINEMVQEFSGLVENNVLPKLDSFFEKLEKEVKKQ